MAVSLLISKANFAPYIDVAANLSDLKLNPRILEAQTFDLREKLGNDFYNSLFDIPVSDDITKLITGDGNYVGIKPALVYFTAARLVKSLDLHITPNGIMTKRSEYSDHVDTKAIAMKVTEYQNLALAWWGEVYEYINMRGKEVYPLFKDFEQCGGYGYDFRPRIFGISGKGTNSNYYGSGQRDI